MKIIYISPGFIILFVLSQLQTCDALMTKVDKAMVSIESTYNELEDMTGRAYENLKNKITGLVLSITETLDSRISQAMIKIKGISEDCRIPAQLSLYELSNKVKQDFGDCMSDKMNDKLVYFKDECESVVQSLKESYNTSIKSINECIKTEYTAMKELRITSMGMCEIQLGIELSGKLLQNFMSVNKYAVDVLQLSFDSTKIVATCFKEELIDTSAAAIVSQAEKCQKRFNLNSGGSKFEYQSATEGFIVKDIA